MPQNVSSCGQRLCQCSVCGMRKCMKIMWHRVRPYFPALMLLGNMNSQFDRLFILIQKWEQLGLHSLLLADFGCFCQHSSDLLSPSIYVFTHACMFWKGEEIFIHSRRNPAAAQPQVSAIERGRLSATAGSEITNSIVLCWLTRLLSNSMLATSDGRKIRRKRGRWGTQSLPPASSAINLPLFLCGGLNDFTDDYLSETLSDKTGLKI